MPTVTAPNERKSMCVVKSISCFSMLIFSFATAASVSAASDVIIKCDGVEKTELSLFPGDPSSERKIRTYKLGDNHIGQTPCKSTATSLVCSQTMNFDESGAAVGVDKIVQTYEFNHYSGVIVDYSIQYLNSQKLILNFPRFKNQILSAGKVRKTIKYEATCRKAKKLF